MSKVVLPGTFDPVTRGHEALIARAAKLFGTVVVGVAAGVHKKTVFSLGERLDMAAQATADIGNVEVIAFEGLLADFLRQQQSRTLVRGIRAVSDFEFESQLADTNRALIGDVETVFLLPDRDYIYVSSGIVREIALLGGEVEKFVSPHVAQRLRQKLAV